MRSKNLTSATFAGIVLGLALASSASQLAASSTTISRQDADRLQEKIVVIVRNGFQRSALPRRTSVSETEVNAYLRFHAPGQLPVGVSNPTMRILGGGRLQGRAIVDLDVMRRQRSNGGWLDPRSYLSGRVPVIATGVLHTSRGVGRFQLERAEVGGFPVPAALLQELVTYYSRSPEYPRGINVDAPFALPNRIREIELAEGRAVIVQQ